LDWRSPILFGAFAHPFVNGVERERFLRRGAL
jgi:hypothetical protein